MGRQRRPTLRPLWRAWVVVVVDRAEPEQKEVVETLPPPTITCPGRDGRVVSRSSLKDHATERNPSTEGRTRVFRLAGHIRHRRHLVMAHNRQRRRRRSRDKGKGPDTATRHRLGSKNAHHAAVRAGRQEHRMSEGPERESGQRDAASNALPCAHLVNSPAEQGPAAGGHIQRLIPPCAEQRHKEGAH